MTRRRSTAGAFFFVFLTLLNRRLAWLVHWALTLLIAIPLLLVILDRDRSD